VLARHDEHPLSGRSHEQWAEGREELDMRGSSHSLLRFLVTAILLIATTAPLLAHAILVASNPAANSILNGPNVDVVLKFNVRIDAARSRLQLISPSGTARSLPTAAGSAANVTVAKANDLTPGKYKLIWQVLASDGHITRGEIDFQVK
jgi:copper resistance protein C